MDSIRASRVPPPHLRFEPMARALGGRQRPHPLSGSGKAMMLNAFVPEDAAKSIIKPSRAEPSRAEPSRAEPSRAEPSRAEPSRAEPSRAEPSRAEPSRAEPSRAEPSRAEPSRAEDFARAQPGRLTPFPSRPAGRNPSPFRQSRAAPRPHGTPAVVAGAGLAQAFTTGTNTNGHELTGIKVKFGTILGTLPTTGRNATFTASAADGPSSRSTVVANLTNPSTRSTRRHEPRRDTVNGRTPHG